MLWTIFVILMILWLLGVVSSYTLGGFVHLLLIMGDSCSLEEALELCEVAADLRWVCRVK